MLPDISAEARIVVVGLGLLILLIVIFGARKIYWNKTGLSKRKRLKLERQRRKIILIIAGLAACVVTTFLALFVSGPIAFLFAVLSFLIIVIVFSAYGRGRGKGTPGDLPHGYID